MKVLSYHVLAITSWFVFIPVTQLHHELEVRLDLQLAVTWVESNVKNHNQSILSKNIWKINLN